MALSTKLELRQGQQLVMTPQLQQAIRLLQLSNIELMQYVETELERNPLLEPDDGNQPASQESVEPAEDGKSDDAPLAAEAPAAEGAEENWLDLGKPVEDPAGTFDTEFDNVYPDTAPADFNGDQGASGWASLRQRNTVSDDDVNIEAYVANDVSLRQHLGDQLPLVLKDPVQRLIGQYLVDLVDEAGYLQADLTSLPEKLGAPQALIDEVLATLQTLDPPGVFARSLSECLALQLKEQNRFDPVIGKLLENLHLVAAHNFAALKKTVGIDLDEVMEIIAEIKRLNPKPGLKYGSVQMQPIVPDVLVRPAPDGSWIVELNVETLPKVLVNRTYLAHVTKNVSDRNYLMECLQTANWLVKSLDQRARTILRVSEEIVRQQDGFLTHGVQFLRPLNLKTVADAISMHESTVSRVTSNKYIATPRGIFELKYFFTSAIASADDGESHSSEAVRHRIKQMIDGETAADVLSDDKIVEMLKTDGIDIARRTVAKYREAMRIPSSVQRRRDKRLAKSCL
jgi:RNA polymerase sigma-54 factor